MRAAWLLGVAVWAMAGVALAGAPGTLTVGMSQFPPDLHPDIAHSSAKAYVDDAMLRPVVSYDMAGNVVCVLCTEVPSVANGLAKVVSLPDGKQGMTVTYHLRHDIYWADGVRVTAKDVVFAHKVSQVFGPTPNVTDVRAVGDDTVVVSLDATRYDFARLISTPLPEHVEGKVFAAAKTPLDYTHATLYATNPTDPGLWDGPYRLTKYVEGQTIEMRPNPYWKGTKPGYREIAMRLIPDTASLEANALSGDVDMISSALGLTVDQVIAMQRRYPNRFNYVYVPTLSYEHLAINLDNPLLADRRVRQALLMAIDRGTIVAQLFRGLQPVAESFLSPSQFGWHKDTKAWPHDPAAARRLLAAAGFKPGRDGIMVSPKGERFEVTLTSTAGNNERALIEQVLRTEFRVIGVALDLKNEPARTLFGLTLRKRQFTGMVLYSTVFTPDEVPWLNFDSESIPSAANNWFGKNYTGYDNPVMDRAIAAARSELDPTKRYADWKTILDLYATDLPELPLFFDTEPFIVPKTMTGVVPLRMRDFATMQIEDWRTK